MVTKINAIIEEYSKLKPTIKKHLLSFDNKTEKEQYKEFMFCLLTPQSNARSCWEAVQMISKGNPKNKKAIASILRGRARFHNIKAERIKLSKSIWNKVQFFTYKEQNTLELRNKVCEIVNGYGLKEAGHFLRNIGKSNNKIAILDRHILRNLVELGAIKDTKIKSNKRYLELEQQALAFSHKIDIPIDELDLLFWYKEHGEFFK